MRNVLLRLNFALSSSRRATPIPSIGIAKNANGLPVLVRSVGSLTLDNMRLRLQKSSDFGWASRWSCSAQAQDTGHHQDRR